jgi:hypothetical protein
MAKRKSLDLIVLLMISVFVISASALVYYSLEMQTTATITYSKVRFDTGTDWSGLESGSSLSPDKTYVFLNITAYPNATLTYDQPLVINNTDSAAHLVRFSHVSITPNATASVSNFTFINFTLNGVHAFDYTTTGDNWNAPTDMTYQSLSGTTEWDVKIETKAAAGATTDGSVTCTIVIALDVQE